MNRNKVVGYDINPDLIRFAKFRNKKFGLKNVTFTTEKPDFSKFDLIVATDALEHLEDLQSFLMELGQSMKVGAKLYHYDVWGEQDVTPMHFDHSTHIEDWLKEAGLYVWNENWAAKP